MLKALESNDLWMKTWTLFAIQGHWILLHMYFRPGRAERAKHPLRVSPGSQAQWDFSRKSLDLQYLDWRWVLWLLFPGVVLVIQPKLCTAGLVSISSSWKCAAVLLEACKLLNSSVCQQGGWTRGCSARREGLPPSPHQVTVLCSCCLLTRDCPGPEVCKAIVRLVLIMHENTSFVLLLQ